MIEGLSHLTFVVRDLDRATRFWRTVFEAQEVYSSGAQTFSVSREKFFLAAGVWVVVMEGEPSCRSDYGHVAFKIDGESCEEYLKRIQSLGLEMEPGRTRVEGEGMSIYFRDFDGHRFELHTGTLQERLERYEAAGE